jgi:hypothetical protein
MWPPLPAPAPAADVIWRTGDTQDVHADYALRGALWWSTRDCDTLLLNPQILTLLGVGLMGLSAP